MIVTKYEQVTSNFHAKEHHKKVCLGKRFLGRRGKNGDFFFNELVPSAGVCYPTIVIDDKFD